MPLAQLIEQYLAGPSQLRQSIADLTPEQLEARPVSGKWSTLEVVCHLADFEPIMAVRMKRVIAEEKPPLVGVDENCFAKALAYHDRAIGEELGIIERTRSQMARILRKLPESALERTGIHNERGPRTLEQLLTGAINHIPHHVKFIQEKRVALGLT